MTGVEFMPFIYSVINAPTWVSLQSTRWTNRCDLQRPFSEWWGARNDWLKTGTPNGWNVMAIVSRSYWLAHCVPCGKADGWSFLTACLLIKTKSICFLERYREIYELLLYIIFCEWTTLKSGDALDFVSIWGGLRRVLFSQPSSRAWHRCCKFLNQTFLIARFGWSENNWKWLKWGNLQLLLLPDISVTLLHSINKCRGSLAR